MTGRMGLILALMTFLLPSLAWAAWPQPLQRWTRTAAAETIRVDDGPWDRFLGAYVRPGRDGLNRVAYGSVSAADKRALQAYLNALQSVDVDRLTKAQQKAYWINLYNAATVDLMLDNYPIKSIRNIGVLSLGPWDRKILAVKGQKLSLNDVEHRILRPIWRDVRIHYAVNCASVGCPNLARTAYRPNNIEALLEAGARDYVNSPRGFARVNGKLTASSIYDWYEGDWGSEAAVLAHARKYARGGTAALLSQAVTIDGYHYDWSLNEAR